MQHEKITVRNLTKNFGHLRVIDNLNLAVAANEFVAVVGPTGCGKTTLLNLFSKLLLPSHGDIFIDGARANPKNHNISFVFQEPVNLHWRTVAENVAYGMEVKKIPKHVRAAKVADILRLMGLSEYAEFYPGQLSASLLQRIAVARAFVTDPDLLLMDEPYGQLDVKLRFYLCDELIRLHQTLKSTIIFVTHNVEEALYMANRVVILSNKPTTVKTDMKIDLRYPRDVLSPEFVELRKSIIDLIKWW